MRVRIALWWVALCAALVGLSFFLVADFGLERTSLDPYAPLKTRTGAQMLALGLTDGIDRVLEAMRKLGSIGMHPDPAIWLSLATITALVVPLLLRMRPTPRTRAVLGAVTIAVLIPTAAAVLGMERTRAWKFAPGVWAWLGAITLLLASPWLRRRDQVVALQAWDARPAKPVGELGKLDNLSATLGDLVRETRAVRVSLDVLSGVDSETARLVWDWQHSVDHCAADDAALLAELGLSPDPAAAALTLEGRTDTERLLELDKALAGFENELRGYRSFGFR